MIERSKTRVSVIALWLGLVAVALSACESTGGAPVEKPYSFREIKFSATVRQQFDFSCGAATLATVLTYYWGEPTSEIAVMNVLRSRYPDQDWKALQQRGFSFDDLIWTAAKLGFEGQGAEIPAAQLAKIDGPVIVSRQGQVPAFFGRSRGQGRSRILVRSHCRRCDDIGG